MTASSISVVVVLSSVLTVLVVLEKRASEDRVARRGGETEPLALNSFAVSRDTLEVRMTNAFWN